MTQKKLFGTDGVRGMANVYPLTPESVAILGRAIAKYFKNKNPKNRSVASIGMDPRLSSSMLANAVAAGIQSAGVDVVMLGVVPTPLVSTAVVKNAHSFGIVVSASHNPYHDNGIKIFNEKGTKLNDKEELEIEAIYFKNDDEKPESKDIGKFLDDEFSRVQYVNNLKDFYCGYLNNIKDISLSVDCANGAFSKVAATVFEEFSGFNTKIYNNSPDGININDNCGALYPQNLAQKVIDNKSLMGVTFDGDGDRFLALDELGNVVDGDKLIGMAAVFLKSQGKLQNNTVVTTVMSNAGLESYLKDNGIKLLRAGVGDKYVFEMMKETDSVLGGENSGHIILMDCNPTGDGMAAALLTLSVMMSTGKKLSELAQDIKLFPQVLTKIKVKEKTPLDEIKDLKELTERFEKELEGGRIFLRYSGTEAVLRILAEGPNEEKVKEVEKKIREFLLEKLT